MWKSQQNLAVAEKAENVETERAKTEKKDIVKEGIVNLSVEAVKTIKGDVAAKKDRAFIS